jgi:outer membrane protein TolC
MIDETPAELKENVSPVLLKNMSITYEWNNDSLSASTRQLYEIHPDIKILEYKNSVLDIDKKLKISKLLPQLDVKYNFLYNPNQAIFFSDNYKWGVDFKIPIPMREARGDLGITKLKIKETEYAIAMKKMELSAKLNTNFIKYNNYQSQRNLYREMYRNYQTLFQAEVSRFDLGESSVFLVNSREIKLIEAELKWYEMIAKSTNAFYELIQSTGKLIF